MMLTQHLREPPGPSPVEGGALFLRQQPHPFQSFGKVGGSSDQTPQGTLSPPCGPAEHQGQSQQESTLRALLRLDGPLSLPFLLTRGWVGEAGVAEGFQLARF